MTLANLATTVSERWKSFTKARRAILPVFVPSLDLVADGVATINATVANGGAVSAQTNIQFQCDGYIVGIRASVETGAALDAACVQMAVDVDGVTHLFITGQSTQGFVPVAQFSGTSENSQFRIIAPFKAANPWTVYFKNVGTTASVGVDVSFLYCNTSKPAIVE